MTLTSMNELPGPKPWPLVGNLLQLQPDRIHLDVEQLVREHGSVFKMAFGPVKILVISDHELINAAMKDRPDGFRRPSRMAEVIDEMKVPLGLFAAEGAAWQAQRRMVMSAFSPSHVRAFFPALRQVAQRLEGRWLKASQQGQAVDLQADLMRYTVDAISGLAFGQDTNTLESDDDIIQQHLDHIFPMLAKRLFAPIPYWRVFKLPADRQLERSLVHINQAIKDFMAQARQRLAQDPARRDTPPNLLEAMIVAADQPDSGVADADVAGNVFTMLLAGEDTTANTLAWLFYLLARHPEALAQAQAEARRVAPTLQDLTMEQVNDLPYIESCLHETMRLKPVAPFLTLEALKDTAIGHVQVPQGTLIWCVNRFDATSDQCFDQAARFDPSRWQAADATHAKRVSIPFGSGPRVCPGRYLSLVEMKLAAVMLLSRFDLQSVSTVDGAEAREFMSFTMTPMGLRMRLAPRQG